MPGLPYFRRDSLTFYDMHIKFFAPVHAQVIFSMGKFFHIEKHSVPVRLSDGEIFVANFRVLANA